MKGVPYNMYIMCGDIRTVEFNSEFEYEILNEKLAPLYILNRGNIRRWIEERAADGARANTRAVKGYQRISKTAGTIGSLLNICPLLNMDYLGRLIPRFKIRTKKKVIRAIVDKMEEYAQDGLDYSGKCYISQSACLEDAKEVARLVEERFPKLNGKVEINSVGTTIGSHTGPGTVALFFWGSRRTA